MTRALAWMAFVTSSACTAAAVETPRAEVGQPAPAFTLPDLDGTSHSLAAYKGKTVVLEWFNPGCPYVKDAHGDGGALDDTASRLTADGQVVWLAINSGAAGKQGHDPKENRDAAAAWKMSHPILRDVDGAVGRAYGAATTPHMFVIDGNGILQYEGAVDNQPMRQATGDRIPYLERAVADLKEGGSARTPKTKPWGCSVKY